MARGAGPSLQDRVAACSAAALAGEFAVIADFDRTMTRCFLTSGGRGTSAHGVLESANVLTCTFQNQAKVLFDKYFPVEMDPNMSSEEKIPIMNQWYGQVHGLILEEDVTLDKLREAVSACDTIELREGMVDLIQACQDASPPVPFIVMSAGLGDVIDEVLRQQLPFPLAPTTHVVSNRMQFDDEGKLVAFSEPLLHMFNKRADFMPSDSRKLVDKATHCMLLGDSVGDVTMAHGLDAEPFLVGFLNEKIEERRAEYSELYHYVITGDKPVPDICFHAIGSESRCLDTDDVSEKKIWQCSLM